MQSLKSIIQGVIGREAYPFRVKVSKASFTIQLDEPKRAAKKARVLRPLKPQQRISTIGGLLVCTVAEFDPLTYLGLKKNCGRKRKDGKPIAKHAPTKPALNPTNVGDPNNKRK